MTLTRDEMHEGNERFYEAMNAQDVDAVLALVDESVVDHQLPPDMPDGAAGVKEFFTMMFASTPDMHFEILDEIISGNRAAIRSRVTGTQTGPFMGMAPTGKSFDVEGIDIVDVSDEGKLLEHWGIFDFAKMMQQTEMAPPG